MTKTNDEKTPRTGNNSIHFKLALFWIFLAVAFHSYLTYVHFGHLAGSFEKSFCDVNSLFSCSSVATSKYSKFLGLPISLWGLMMNLVLGFFLIESYLHAVPHFLRYTNWLAFGVVGGSLVMGAISLLFMSQYCPFCIGLVQCKGLRAGCTMPATPP